MINCFFGSKVDCHEPGFNPISMVQQGRKGVKEKWIKRKKGAKIEEGIDQRDERSKGSTSIRLKQKFKGKGIIYFPLLSVFAAASVAECT